MSVIHGDCLDVMRGMDAASVDAIVTDPPYGLAFMGKAWDHGVPGVPFWDAALRVAKPGTYLLAFGGTRTYHRLACAIEDAGWEIHDCLSWLYGSGFPKHASKLKPAWEPVVLARKPAPRATPLNVEACRIEGDEDGSHNRPPSRIGSPSTYAQDEWTRNAIVARKDTFGLGRWPANVMLDEEAGAALDAQSGTLTSNSGNLGKYKGRTVNTYGGYAARSDKGRSDSGGASRFFYCAKASRSEREAGLEGFQDRTKRILNGGIPSAVNSDPVGMSGGGDRTAKNHHPTVKPVALMRWLVRLVTPAGGLVLDPFAGSGTTGIAATMEGRRFVGIEREAEYAEIALARIAAVPPTLDGVA